MKTLYCLMLSLIFCGQVYALSWVMNPHTGKLDAIGEPGSRGYDGYDGPPGTQILTELGTPAGGLGVDNDFYLDTSNGDYYAKSSGTWTLRGNLTGPQGPAGPAATVDQPSVLSALAAPGGNPTTRQPVNPQTDTTAMWQVRDLIGNVRLWISGDGTITKKAANGNKLFEITPDNNLLQYRGDGVRLAFQAYSSGRVVIQ